MSIRLILAVTLCLSTFLPALAQTAAQPEQIEGGKPEWVAPETPKQRMARLGTTEDPGLNPDPEKVWLRFGHRFKIERFDRQWASYESGSGESLPAGQVRPLANVNWALEIYQQNERYVWVWMPLAEDIYEAAKVVPSERSPQDDLAIAYLKKVAPEFTPLTPRDAGKVIRFEESSRGLPSDGSWRNSATVADMNGDGHLDIVAPPERGSRGFMPAIFLGDGKGNWSVWKEPVWPFELQYGNVVAADFNGDGIPDLAFGQHLTGPRVLLNNGKGRFTDASEGMAEHFFPTRRVAAADVNADGLVDLLVLFEGPAPGITTPQSRIRAYLNQGKAKSWKLVEPFDAKTIVSGDWLAVGKFNRDRYPDFVSSNLAFQRPETLFESTGPAQWKVVDWQEGSLVPFLSVYGPVVTGRFSSRTLDDAIVTYARSWPVDYRQETVPAPEITSVVGIDRISFAGKTPVRTSIMRWNSQNGVSGVAAGDFDGDGKLDILFTRSDPRDVVLLLGDGKGGFRRITIEGLDLAENPNYDLTVADVNGDGRPDVLIMYESTTTSPFGRQNGSIRLFLNRGTQPAARAE